MTIFSSGLRALTLYAVSYTHLDDGDGAAVDARDKAGRIVVGLHRIARAVIEHVARVHDEVSTLEEALAGMGPGHLVAVCIADDPDFHKDSPFLFSFVS